VKLATQNEE